MPEEPGSREMRKLSICELTYDMSRSFEEHVDETARHGIEALGVIHDKVEQIGAGRARQALRDAGLKTAGYHAAGYFTRPGQLDAQVEHARRCIENAAALEADCLVVVTGPGTGLTWEEGKKLFLEGVHAIAATAQASGVELALEALHPRLAFSSFVHTLGDALDICDEAPGMGVLFDIYHTWWDRRVFEDIERGAERIYNVQVSDFDDPLVFGGRRVAGGGSRLPPGKGIVPLKRLLHALDARGYDRYYDLEVIDDLTEERRLTLVSECLEGWNAIWA